ERGVAGAHQCRVVRQRHFRDLEFLELQHAPENVWWLRGDVVEIDSLGLDRPVTQGERAVVGTAGKCQTQLAHSVAPGAAPPNGMMSQRCCPVMRGLDPRIDLLRKMMHWAKPGNDGDVVSRATLSRC